MSRSAPLPWALCLLLCLAAPARAADPPGEMMLVAVRVNGEGRGEHPALRTPQGTFLVPAASFLQLGLGPLPPGSGHSPEPDAWIDLSALPESRVAFDTATLTLDIVLPPERLPVRRLDFRTPRRTDLEPLSGDSAFLNYGAGLQGGDGGSSRDLDLELGVRRGGWLLLSDQRRAGGRPLRLMTRLVRDRPQQLQRLVLGDHYADSGSLGGTLNLGGVSLTKVYAIDPYFVRNPTARLSGVLPSPAEVEIYLDGVRVRSEELGAGPFELEGLDYYGGSRNVQVLVRDAFGREQFLTRAYYFTDSLLAAGLHEYGYAAGLQREAFGSRSADYGAPAAALYHRYGVSDDLTAGLRGEAGEGFWNAGPELTLRLPGGLGIATLAGAAGGIPGAAAGGAGLLGYSYQARRFNAGLRLETYAASYADSTHGSAPDRPSRRLEASIGTHLPGLGNLGLSHAEQRDHDGGEGRTDSLTYSRTLGGRLSLFTTLSRGRDPDSGSDTRLFLGLSLHAGGRRNVSLQHQQDGDGGRQSLQVTRPTPAGEGFGYRLAMDHDAGEVTLSPYARWHGRRGILSGELRTGGAGGGDSWRLRGAGALAWADGHAVLTRPIHDAFALVRVGTLENVRVSLNHQAVGRTDSRGLLPLPDLSGYLDNAVTIDGRDIPLDYAFATRERHVAPPHRGGVLVDFPLRRVRAVAGRLLRSDGTPAGHGTVTLGEASEPLQAITLRDGGFYLEGIAPGRHRGRYQGPAGGCDFLLEIPATEQVVLELGEVRCDAPER